MDGGAAVEFVLVSGGEAFRLEGCEVTPGDLGPESLRRLFRDRTGVDALVLHAGDVLLGGRAGPVLLETLETTTPNLPRVEAPAIPNARAWQRAGWHAQVLGWLGSLGVTPIRLEQVGTSDLSSVVRVITADETLYFKAGEGALEAALTAALARLTPRLTLEVVAVHGPANWLLSRNGGSRLIEFAERSAWLEAVEGLAALHRETLATAALELGAPLECFAQFFDSAGSLLEAQAVELFGMTALEVERFAHHRGILERAHSRIASAGMPDALCHGDAHPMNALRGPRGSVWFDWSEGRVMHPLLDVGWFLGRIAMQPGLAVRLEHPDVLDTLWRAYLGATGRSDLEPLLDDVIALGLLQRAWQFHGQTQRTPPSLPSLKPMGVPWCLRRLLAHLESTPA